MGEFEAVAEGSACGENRIPQAQRANLYAEINGASGTHFAQKDTTNCLGDVAELALVLLWRSSMVVDRLMGRLLI